MDTNAVLASSTLFGSDRMKVVKEANATSIGAPVHRKDSDASR